MSKANSIVNKFLLAGDKFIAQLHLINPIVKNTVHVDHLQNTNKKFKIFYFKYRQVKLYLQK